ncbi:2-(3-amino-3-carboxypropyl)histidine synthase subunit [Lachnellula hyalina]|uniref:2-(3-amino-3-carboxypropyl)histidine synthase subunit 2 n=1 Tax=Lachnellula hyalina TaxID=1316788 RepID=A0A8H8R325_9HELO|nr:2-(3-amino-3-carboxypropyl)histidine synthase subunit [Lachnellula hyalina]TVY27136.1 2-(3-amino-3-carboxypropyl)histidine synthase subunit [Lachnellula hyalina]
MTAQTQAPVLSTPESNLFETPAPSTIPAKENRLSDAELRDVYETSRTAREIRDGGWTKVALQFPDGMLVDAPRVFAVLEELLSEQIPKVNSVGVGEGEGVVGLGVNEKEKEKEKEKGARENRVRLYILADTSYGSCCVDEVAAEHVDAEAVVHYGRACLSPTSRLPVVYVFTRRALDIAFVVEGFEESFSGKGEGEGGGKEEKVVVMADLTFQEHVPVLVERLRERGWKGVRGTDVVHDPTASIPNRRIAWRRDGNGEEEEEEGDLKEWSIWHIGSPPAALLLTLSSRIKELLIYPGTTPQSTSTNGNANRNSSTRQEIIRSNTSLQLRRRYALLTRLTTTPIIGILINTLSVANYLSSIDALKALIARKGKKSYTFVVGKVNAAKMANFAEVGGWVVVGCWESSLVESKEFYAPVLTPFELGLALESDGERVWSGEWRGDFGGLDTGTGTGTGIGEKTNGHEGIEEAGLDGEGKDGELGDVGDVEDEDGDSEEESAPPEFDLRTGRYVSNSRPMRTTNPTKNTTSSSTPPPSASTSTSAASQILTRRPKQELASINGAVSPGAEFLRSQRTWTGLGSDFEEIREGGSGGGGGTIEEGRSGVARGYTVGKNGERT